MFKIKMIKLFKILFILKCGVFLLFFQTVSANEKIKIGLLVPMTGSNKEIGQSIIKAVSLAVKDIDNNLIENHRVTFLLHCLSQNQGV